MRDYSAAFLALVIGTVKALLTPARGRHAARRRRSTRVRRYAPLPAVDPVQHSGPYEPRAPRLARPTEVFPADEIALVRPYYLARERARAQERDLDRIQAQATARLQAWIPQQRPHPSGDLLAAPLDPVFTGPNARVRAGAGV
jgi:hypothetical protein